MGLGFRLACVDGSAARGSRAGARTGGFGLSSASGFGGLLRASWV